MKKSNAHTHVFEAIRTVKVSTGHTLVLWDTHRMIQNSKARLGYKFVQPDGATLFEGEDFGSSPMHGTDSDSTVLALLGFLTLRPGDTDAEYFDRYTPAQMEWAQSSACENLSCEVSIAEEAIGHGGCACAMWTNLDGWTCEDAGNVADFQVLDHGEDGSQYFPGCGTYGTDYDAVATGVGDTGAEALDDALESMAQNDVRPSKLQEHTMRAWLDNPDKSAHASLDAHDCEKDGCDWNHYVSVRYSVRKDG